MTTSTTRYPAAPLCVEILNRVATETNLNRLQRLIPLVARASRELREQVSDDVEWRSIAGQLRSHPACKRLHQDPYTNRAFQKPRGYAGDAAMLDYIYKPALDSSAWEIASADGKAILAYTSECPAARAVRNRRALLAVEVDSMSNSRPRPRIASLACGYLREAELLSSIELGRVERYYAMDQDDECIQHVSLIFRDTPVKAVSASVRDLLKRTPAVEEVCDLDFFYAAGIFDYLKDSVAEALAAELFRRLKPGGKFWIPNFVPDIPDRAYMEAFMDWWLIYRSPDALGRLDARIPEREIAGKRLFLESEANVAFLELVRA